MLKTRIAYLLFLLLTITLWGQNLQEIDVLQYTNSIAVSDANDSIFGSSDIEILFNKTISSFDLDLISTDETGKGMAVSSVLENGKKIKYVQGSEKLTIYTTSIANNKKTYTINYSGIPADGLIISHNKYGDRTFFGDNWPNRARNWVPCIDHPSDKALVTFKITAPSHYQVIANGALTEKTNLNNDSTYYVWKTHVPIPTKVMVIGVAKFAVENIGETYNIPVSSWVYPQGKEAGFYDFELTKSILKYFIENIGPYPYQKLASVQSKTRYGGMENASNIFYPENFITGNRSKEEVMAHEVAHQWFGNSTTEIDWPHIWLSEGFATYFASLYMRETHGEETFKKLLIKDRQDVIGFSKRQFTAVVDYETKDLLNLLNRNSYEKGGWFLHMLHHKIGDSLFWKGIQAYYDSYKLSNASTEDLRIVFEKETGQDLKSFFNQWLYTYGQPVLSFESSVEGRKFNLNITQKQEYVFTFPLELKLIYEDGTKELKTVDINKKEETISFPIKKSVRDFEIDPNVNLLFEQAN